MRYRYIRWDGTQQIDDFTADDVMRQVADDLLDDGDLENSLRRMLRRGADFDGGRRLSGLQDLIQRLRQTRQQNLDRYNLGSMIDDIKERLDQVIESERAGIHQRIGESPPDAEGNSAPPLPGSGDPMLRELLEKMARKHLDQLDQLPPDMGGRIKQLRDYDFMDPNARQQFEELLQSLQQQVMQNYFKGLQQGLQSVTPESLSEMKEMVRDLNQLLQQRQRGETPDFHEFMQKWSQYFPKDIKNLDQLIEYLQKQMAQMDALLKSMSPEMRRELEEMIDSIFGDSEFQWEMAQLAANMERIAPGGMHPGEFPFGGDEPITLQDAMRLMGDMNRLDTLEQELMQAAQKNDVSDLDSDEIGRLLGQEAQHMARQLQDLTRMLEEAGLIQKKGSNWELTPRAIRKIGERAIQDIFGKLKSSTFGNHAIETRGVGPDRLDETKRYEFGDPFLVDAQKSLMNAVVRHGAGTPIRLQRDDFEVYRTETVTQASTVIMLDMSYSMMMGGRFQAGRKVALALDSLIRSKFPRDNLYVVAFSYFVLTLKPEMLLDSYWVEYGGGTNFQEALRQARLVLSRHKSGTKQIILITDGEPTTYSYSRPHRSPGGGLDWDVDDHPTARSGLDATLREVVRCTRDNIVINTFMLDRAFQPTGFVRAMTKLNRGRAFFAPPDRLGEYILLDYVSNKQKLVR